MPDIANDGTGIIIYGTLWDPYSMHTLKHFHIVGNGSPHPHGAVGRGGGGVYDPPDPDRYEPFFFLGGGVSGGAIHLDRSTGGFGGY